jgi:hypothetical protein
MLEVPLLALELDTTLRSIQKKRVGRTGVSGKSRMILK